MSAVAKIFGKWSSVPWRPSLIVIGASFLIASVINTMIAHVFLTKEANAGKGAAASKPVDAVSSASFNVPTPAASLSQNGVDLILKRNIFNSEGAATDETKKDDDANKGPQTQEAVKSDLPVKLIGTIYGGDPYSGIALVENSTKKTTNSFMVGDTLTKESIVKEIHKERIIIDRSGRLEYIEVDRQELSRSKRKKKAKEPAVANNAIGQLATEPPPNAFKEDGFERKEREMVMTSAYKQKLLTSDFTKVLQDAKASPNMVDGELKGFLLTRIRKDSIYEKAGLQNDDIVSEINGIPLTDTAQAIRLLQSLRNEAEIEIRIVRGGAPMNFTMQVK